MMGKNYISEKRMIQTSAGKLRMIVLRPKKVSEQKPPGILWIHGGGYATGMAGMIYMSRALPLVKKYGAVVVTPEYRLAGKAPYPAALEDCYAALIYLKDHWAELGCDPDRIMVGGESAGGGLTSALCMYAKDKGEVNVAFQMPLYPMIDHEDTLSSRDNHGISWNTKRNHAAWKLYLRNVENDVPAYAAPAQRKDHRGLPPCYTFVGDKEAFYCETITYIENLQKAGVPAKVDVYPTGFHAFDMLLPFRRISKKAVAAFEREYLYAAKHYFAPQKNNITYNKGE